MYPEFHRAIVQFADDNLYRLSIDLMNEFINRGLEIIAKYGGLNADVIIKGNDKDIGSDDAFFVDNKTDITMNNNLPKKDQEDSQQTNNKNLEQLLADIVKEFDDVDDPSKRKKPLTIPTPKDKIQSCMNKKQQKIGKRSLSLLKKKGISSTTTHEWMIKLGYKYNTHKKSFYTDNHEKETTVAYRIQFINRYLKNCEPYMLRWIQIKKIDIKSKFAGEKLTFKKEKQSPNKRRRYALIVQDALEYISTVASPFTDNDGTDWMEFHVDTIMGVPQLERLKPYVEEAEREQVDGLGANMSYFRNDKNRLPLISIG